MSRTPASTTQADIARAIRAAQQCGAGEVRVILPGGAVIAIQPRPGPAAGPAAAGEAIPLAPEPEIVL
ncbi:MAG: hypothetical protein ACOY6K_12460 [Pseudomonadota bacterium]